MAMFDDSKVLSLTGTVREFQWTNPHCYIQLVVRNEQGVEEEYSIEMNSPLQLMGGGWKKSTVKPGDKITVKIHPLRNGDKGGDIVDATTPEGKPLVASP